MPTTDTEKHQPWKDLASLEENRKPDFSKFSESTKKAPCLAEGATVSKPMDRKTAQSIVDKQQQQQQDGSGGSV